MLKKLFEFSRTTRMLKNSLNNVNSGEELQTKFLNPFKQPVKTKFLLSHEEKKEMISFTSR